MSALYVMAGSLSGAALTAISMGSDGRMALLFIPSFVLVVTGSFIEYHNNK